MMRALALWLLLCAAPASALAQTATLLADAVRIANDERLIAEGNVQIAYDGALLTATRITYDRAADRLYIDGPITLDDGEGTANIAATRLDGATGTFQIDAAFDNADRQLTLRLLVEEDADGIAARLMNIPEKPSVRLLIEGDAPVDEFAATLALDTDGQERLTGEFQVSSSVNTTSDTPLLRCAYCQSKK